MKLYKVWNIWQIMERHELQTRASEGKTQLEKVVPFLFQFRHKILLGIIKNNLKK